MKNFTGIIVGLVIGLVAGYFAHSFLKKDTTVSPLNAVNGVQFGPGSAERADARPISWADAQKYITEYRSSSNGTLMGISDVFNGFFVDTAALHAILKDQSLVGISFYIGKHPEYSGTAKNVVSFYLTGAKLNPKFNQTKPVPADPPLINSNVVYEYVDPCPKLCGTLAP